MTTRSKDIEAVKIALAALPDTPWPGGYSEAGLAIVDAIYSVGANYKTTIQPMIRRYRGLWSDADQHDALRLIRNVEEAGGPSGFADRLGNRQRTSSRSGILKADAVLQAAHLLVAAGLPNTSLIREATDTPELDGVKTSWLRITGQRSGITWRYFLMLVGIQGVKPDRMIHRFLYITLGRTVSNEEAVAVITQAAAKLGIDTNTADHRIWKHTPRGGSRLPRGG